MVIGYLSCESLRQIKIQRFFTDFNKLFLEISSFDKKWACMWQIKNTQNYFTPKNYIFQEKYTANWIKYIKNKIMHTLLEKKKNLINS